MKQFIVIAYDAKDAGAMQRRLDARAAHTASMTELRARGNMICGAAILDDAEKMIGSVIFLNFGSRSDVDTWLATEPYVTGKVWEKITVLNGKLGASFADLIKKEQA